jgi:hypothetical protein
MPTESRRQACSPQAIVMPARSTTEPGVGRERFACSSASVLLPKRTWGGGSGALVRDRLVGWFVR